MKKGSKAPRVPLKHRLPNPPPLFVGRGRELDWLAAALGRGPVVVLTGPGGIGKTSLFLRMIHERFAPKIPQTVYLGLRPGVPTDQVRFDLVKVLAESARASVDLAAVASDPEALTEAAIDIAEEAELWVVIDDAHHADAGEMGELLTMLSAYARRSRWLVTSRMEPKASALAGQVLPVGAMGEGELIQLARGLTEAEGTTDADLHRAIAASAGSPWFLHQYVVAGPSQLEESRARLLGDLPDAVHAFLDVMSALQIPLPEDVLSELAPLPTPALLAGLERRGVLHRDASGLRLHDVVAEWLAPSGTARPTRELERIAATLATRDDPVLLVESARLFRDAGRLDTLAALLDEQAEQLFAHAQAPRLWAVIGELRDPRLVGHQLRCAAELGNPTALGAVRSPTGREPAERLAWAATVYARGDVGQASALADEIQRAAAGGEAHEAGLLCARCLLHEAREADALALLAGLDGPTPSVAFRRDALRARAYAALADPAAEETLARLRRTAEAMFEELEALHDVALALMELGRLEAADELLERLTATPRGGRASLLVARWALLSRARIRLEAGDAAAAAALLDAVRPYARSASLLRPFLTELEVERRLAVGDLAGLDAVIEAGMAEASSLDRRLWSKLAVSRERLRTMRGLAPEDAPDVVGAVAGAERARWTLARRRGALRHGRVQEGVRQEGGGALALLLDADAALVGDEPERAFDAAERALREATRRDRALLALEAALALADAAAVSVSPEVQAAGARALVEASARIGSTRGRLAAELHQGFDDPAVLERVAAFADVSPVAARRARALLVDASARPTLDAVDARVVAALRSRSPLAVATVSFEVGLREEGASWRPGWGLDGRRQRVWLEDGRTVDLSRKALPWKLLTTLLAAEGGRASKEELALRVWEERLYHPGRHDGRIHMSIRKLRELIEDDPSRPTRLLTDDDGYRLGGVVRLASARQSPETNGERRE
ncbi:MAG: hypothetical protein SangKO_089980 [Sandaracinaceae bacterium]